MKPEPNKQTTYTTLEPVKINAPTIKLTKDAIKWLTAMADIHHTEVGVFGFVDEPEPNVYLIRDIFYPKHSEAAGATCEISPEGEAMMAEWLMTNGRENDISKARFWGHSHVNMGVSPSGQDEIQSIERMNRNQSYLIRGIFNKEGLLSISFYDYHNKRRFDNIKWETDVDNDDAAIRAEITQLKAVNLPVATVNYSQASHFHNQGGFDDGFGAGDDAASYGQFPYMGKNYGQDGGVRNPDRIVHGNTRNGTFFSKGFEDKKNKNKKKGHSYAFEFPKQ